MLDWQQLKQLINQEVETRNLGDEYRSRLTYELKEIEKQGAANSLIAKYNDGFKYTTNKGGLVHPWLLGMTPVDPLTSKHRIELQTDMPDIDLDCVPEAREPLKLYAAERYGKERVCSVGAWLTYKFKLAIQDVVRVNGGDFKEAQLLTTNLPDDVDELKDGGYSICTGCQKSHKDAACPHCGGEETEGVTIGQLLNDYQNLNDYYKVHKEWIDMAVRLVGKIKALSTHAGGLIIADRELFGNVPMALSKGKWTSMWTEGRSPQLSKFGYVKWDVLGLKTLGYINDFRTLIYKTRKYKFDVVPWGRQDKENNIIGKYEDDNGITHEIRMDDDDVYQMINELKVETVFQFETDVQRGILSNKVRGYYDLQVLNALGHPGPMEMIPDYVKRRDNPDYDWTSEEHPEMAALFKETFGIIVYQEQLQAAWMKFAGFTAPEAEAARKAVAKKWVDKLKPIGEQWMAGATKTLGKYTGPPICDKDGRVLAKQPVTWAEFYWERMVTFGRYAFNRSHSVAYIMEAYFTAWYKLKFPPEWWASVMSKCDDKKRVKYMNVARSEGVKFSAINVEDISISYTVDPESLAITPGLTSIKGVGESAVSKINLKGTYTDIDDFVNKNGKNKTVIQSLIHLGAFKKYHPNVRATWIWYQYKYCSGPDATKLRADVRAELMTEWTAEKIKAQVDLRTADFKRNFPKRKVPKSIINWKPKPTDSRDKVMSKYPNDYSLREMLEFEKKYLGYYWHSPMDLYKFIDGATIKAAKEGSFNVICAVVEKVWRGNTKKLKPYARITIADGINTATVMVWQNELEEYGDLLVEKSGIKIYVDYDSERDQFTIRRQNFAVSKLETIDEYQSRIAEVGYDVVVDDT